MPKPHNRCCHQRALQCIMQTLALWLLAEAVVSASMVPTTRKVTSTTAFVALRGGPTLKVRHPMSQLGKRLCLPLAPARRWPARPMKMSAVSGDSDEDRRRFSRGLNGAVGDVQQNLKSSALSVAASAAINAGPDAFATLLRDLAAEGKHESVTLLLVQYGIGFLDDSEAIKIWKQLPAGEGVGGSRELVSALETLEIEAAEKVSRTVRVAQFLSGAAGESEIAMTLMGQLENHLEADEAGVSGQSSMWRLLCGKASVHEASGQYEEAWSAQQRGVALLDEMCEREQQQSLPLAVQIATLARLARLKGEYQEAVMLVERSLQIIMSVTNEPDAKPTESDQSDGERAGEDARGGAELGGVLLEQAACLQAAGMLQRALLAATKGLHIYTAAYGEEHPQTAAAMDSLGLVYQGLGRYDQAAEYHEPALSILEAEAGGGSVLLGSVLYNLATSREGAGEYEEGRRLKERALGVWREQLPEGHAQLATAINGLGENARARGEVQEAVALFEEAIGVWREALGPWHPYVGVALNNLAKAQVALGDAEAGLLLLQKSVAVKREALGDSHPSLATSLNHLAALTETTSKDYERSATMRTEALEILKKSLGEMHPQVAVQANNLAVTLSRQQRYAEASSLYQEALKIDEETYGAVHPQVATDLNNLATLAFHCGEQQLSRQLYERALDIRERVLGDDDAKTQATRRNLELVRRQIEVSDSEED